jgi:hypothetical protein
MTFVQRQSGNPAGRKPGSKKIEEAGNHDQAGSDA